MLSLTTDSKLMNFSPGRPSSVVHQCRSVRPCITSDTVRGGVLGLLDEREASRDGEGSRGEASCIGTCPRGEGAEFDGSTLGEAEVRGLFTRKGAVGVSSLRLRGKEAEEDGVPSRAINWAGPLDGEERLGVADFLTVTTRVVTLTVVPLPLALGALDLEKNPRSEAACRGACILL